MSTLLLTQWRVWVTGSTCCIIRFLEGLKVRLWSRQHSLEGTMGPEAWLSSQPSTGTWVCPCVIYAQ